MESGLLEAAAELLEQEGPDALSIRRIAATAGVAPMGVYNHFTSKSGIIEALFIQGFARLGEAMLTLAAIGDPRQALLEAGRRYRALALAHPSAYQLMFLRAVPGFEPSDHAKEVAGEAFEGLVAAVVRAIDAGVIAGESAEVLAQIIWASIHGFVALELSGIGFIEDQDAGAQLLCATVLDGLRPRS
jgi:AcrR family transcriptional regulator